MFVVAAKWHFGRPPSLLESKLRLESRAISRTPSLLYFYKGSSTFFGMNGFKRFGAASLQGNSSVDVRERCQHRLYEAPFYL